MVSDALVVGTSDGGPSIGGFINAGGFGGGSAQFGGFWENVDAVTLVGADGQTVTHDRRSDELGNGSRRRYGELGNGSRRRYGEFGWLFGAMGQLGIVLEARLDIVPQAGATAPTYPSGNAFNLALREPSTPPVDATTLPPIYWYTLFVGTAEKQEAERALAEIQRRHATDMSFRTPYDYPIKYRAVVAPLVYGRTGDFSAIGIWGHAPDSPAVIHAIDQDVAALARSAGYRRYVQAEVLAGPDAYRDYFGAETYEAFRRMRRAHDPRGLFNRATVFDEPR